MSLYAQGLCATCYRRPRHREPPPDPAEQARLEEAAMREVYAIWSGEEIIRPGPRPRRPRGRPGASG